MDIQKKGGNSQKRRIDSLFEETYSWLGKTFVFINRKRIKSWKAIFIVAFVAGSVSSIVWGASFGFGNTSNAAGQATLSIEASTSQVRQGESFSADIVMNTRGNDVV